MDEWKIIFYIVILNITLSALHFALSKFKDKTKTQLDDKLDSVVSFLLTMLEWVMASRRVK